MHYHLRSSILQFAAMPSHQDVESTLTDRYQTTVPKTVRQALKLGKRDKLQYNISAGGEVKLTRADSSNSEDPVLGQFLDFLARDMVSHPQALQPMTVDLFQRIQALVGDAKVDLNARLLPEDE